MRTLFGLPVGTLAVVLLVVLTIALASIATLALRNLVFFRLGVRNIGRRAGRSVLIVVGLMLATTIIAAALGTGDTMGRTVRSGVLRSLGAADEWVTTRGAKPDVTGALGGSTGVQLFDERVVPRIERVMRSTNLVDGVMPAIIRTVAVQDRTSRQTEARVTLFAADASRASAFGSIGGSSGRAAQLSSLPAGSVYFNRDAASALGARPGDSVVVLTGGHLLQLRVADVVTYRGAGTPKSAILMPLSHLQAAIGAPGKVEEILISNRGGEVGGAALTDAVVSRLRAVLAPAGLDAQPVKQDALKLADKQGAAFISMFGTFGSFSIAAGILLIFLIFVMLAAERRTEMGVARAIGTRRGHLVETFVFEGAAYDLGAAALGAAVGVGVSLALVAGIGHTVARDSLEITYSVRWSSVVVAYALGVVLTFFVVAFSAWRVSVLNIVTAVRNVPEPIRRQGRRGWMLGVVMLALGTMLVVNGRSAAQAMPFLLGLSLLAIGGIPVLRALHVPDRVVYTAAGVSIVVVWLLPFRVVETLVPGAQMDFSMWIVGGLLVVVGAVWTVMYNADALLGAAMAVFGSMRSMAAVLRISMAYPLRSRLRTGITLAMFTLVVFTLVVGITTPNSFIASENKVSTYGGSFDVRAMTSPASPIGDFDAALARAHLATPVRSTASVSLVPVKVRQSGTATKFVDYPLRGLDDGFLRHNRYALGSRANGYTSDAQVWRAVARDAGVAVVDPWIVPHRRNWTFGAITELHLAGFFAEDPTFPPVSLDVKDPLTGAIRRVAVIGVLRDSMPVEMAGVAMSQRALVSQGYGGRAVPTLHLIALAPGTDARRYATSLEGAFLANGLQADSFAKLVHENVAASMVFLRLIEGFMGLGLLVGVAALGVIAARSVVERRQQIGVLRAIGFQASTVRLGFLLESGFLALSSIVVGTALGLALAYNVVDDARRQATWPGVHLVVPWLNLAIVFVLVMVVALLTTYLPARRASRVYPAEALRYE